MNSCWEEFLLQSSLWLGCHRLQVLLDDLPSREASLARAQLILTTRLLHQNAAPFRILFPHNRGSVKFLAGYFYARVLERERRRSVEKGEEDIAAALAYAFEDMMHRKTEFEVPGTADAIGRFLSGVGASEYPFRLRTTTLASLPAVRALLVFEQFDSAAGALPRGEFSGLLNREEIARTDSKAKELSAISNILRKELQHRASHTPSPADSLAYLGGTADSDRQLLSRAERIIRELCAALKEHQRQGIETQNVMFRFDQLLKSLRTIIAGPGIRWRALALKEFCVRAAPFLETQPAELVDRFEEHVTRNGEPELDAEVDGAVVFLCQVAAWLDSIAAMVPQVVWELYRSLAGQLVRRWEAVRIEDGSLTAEQFIEEAGRLPATTIRTGLRTAEDGPWLVEPRARRPLPFCELLEETAAWFEAQSPPHRAAQECRRVSTEVAQHSTFESWSAALRSAHEAAPLRSSLWRIRNVVLAIHVTARQLPDGGESGDALVTRFGQWGFRFAQSVNGREATEAVDIQTAQEAATAQAFCGSLPPPLDFFGPESVEGPLCIPPAATLLVSPCQLDSRPVLRTLYHLSPLLRRIQQRPEGGNGELIACILDIFAADNGAEDEEAARQAIAWCSRICRNENQPSVWRLYRRLGRRLLDCLEQELHVRVFPSLDDRLQPQINEAPKPFEAEILFQVGMPRDVTVLQLGGDQQPARLQLTAEAEVIRWLELPATAELPPPVSSFHEHCRNQFWSTGEVPDLSRFRARLYDWLNTPDSDQWLNASLPPALDELFSDVPQQPPSALARWVRLLLAEGCLPTVPRISLEQKRLFIADEDIDIHSDWPSGMVARYASSLPGSVDYGHSLTSAVAQRRLRLAARFQQAAAEFSVSPVGESDPLGAATVLLEQRRILPESLQLQVGQLMCLTTRQLLQGKPPLTSDVDRQDRSRALDFTLQLADLCLEPSDNLPRERILQAVRDWLFASHSLHLIPDAWNLHTPLTRDEISDFSPTAYVFDAQRGENECVLESFGQRSPKKVRREPVFRLVVGKPPEGYPELLALLRAGSPPEQALAEKLAIWPKECDSGKSEFRLAQDFFVEFYELLDREFRSRYAERFKLVENAMRRVMERHFRFKLFHPKTLLDYPPHWLESNAFSSSQSQVEYVERPGLTTQDGGLCVQAKLAVRLH